MKLYTWTVAALMAAMLFTGCATTKHPAASLTPISNHGFAERISEPSETDKQRWSHLDLAKDSLPGMSVDRAYTEIIKDQKGQTVIVGIIDSGIDVEHEDLKAVMWTNEKEIPGNNIDDDKNGYVDDVYGWNFLGESNDENLEMTRIVKKGDDGSAEFKRAKAAFDQEFREAQAGKQQMQFLMQADEAIREALKKPNYTLEDLKTLETDNVLVNQVRPQFEMILGRVSKEDFDEQIKDGFNYYDKKLKFHLNTEWNGRTPVGDNPSDINDRNYGDPNVTGPDYLEEAVHGTHVAGIVAQIRHNGLGGDGVANNVKIMALRAVPNGDEYDKDIALAIRYAVDNGAKIINGSFGKSFSPERELVYEAIKYAASKDVLFVHAAGNDSSDLDLEENQNFPNDSKNAVDEFADNVLTVGALNPSYSEDLVASFSNYGRYNVDVFAPGQEIYAAVPGNKYRYLQGTSMAAPNVAGVAALIRSHFPKLTAPQVKKIIMDSGIPYTGEVNLGGGREKRSFTTASRSGKMVNAYNALIMAAKMSK